MKCFTFSLVLILFLSFSAVPADAQWVQDGSNPRGVQHIVAKEGNVFITTWGWGVYKSTDGGANWAAVNNFVGYDSTKGIYVYDLVAVPSTTGGGTNLFASLEVTGGEYGRGGVWRSTDDGDNWTWVFPGPGSTEYYDLPALGVAGSDVLAFGGDGPYRSIDGGTWTKWNGAPAGADSGVTSFASLTMGSTTYLYMGTHDGLFVSTNEGAGWTRISNGLGLLAGKVSILVATPGAGGVGITVVACVPYHGVYRSTDNGTSWTEANSGLPYISDFWALVASPVPGGTVSNIFGAFCNGVYVSTDNGATWSDTGWPTKETGAAECLAINGGMLYGGGGYEIWKYPMASDTNWVVQQSGTKDSLIAVKAVNNNVVWTGGTHGSVLRTTNGGASWVSVGGGSTIGSDGVHAVEALDENTAFVSSFSITGGKIFKTTDGGSSWSTVFNQTGEFIGGIQMKTVLEGYAVGTPVGGKWKVLKTVNGGIAGIV